MTAAAPGAPITYSDRLDHATVSRSGVVWSDGPIPSSVWVLPDHDPTNPALVKLPTAAAARRCEGPKVEPGYPATWQRDTIRRVEALRAHGSLYETRRLTGRAPHSSGPAYEHVQHADPDCPDAESLERSRSPWSLSTIIDVLLGRYAHRCTARLCCRCVYLNESADRWAAA